MSLWLLQLGSLCGQYSLQWIFLLKRPQSFVCQELDITLL